MKNFIKIFSIIIIILLIVIGTVYLIDRNRMKNNEKVFFSTWGYDYANPVVHPSVEDIPEDYDLEQAIKDKCIISTHGTKLFNKDELDTFLEKVNKNEPYTIRCINYTIEGDMIITDVSFAGNNLFKTYHDSTRDKFSSMEDRIIKYEEYKKILTEERDETIWIYLTNEDENNELTITYYNENAEIINGYDSYLERRD